MKQLPAVVYTLCIISVLLNVGLVTKYVTIGHVDMCVPVIEGGFDGTR